VSVLVPALWPGGLPAHRPLSLLLALAFDVACCTSRWASASSATTSPTSATRWTAATRPGARLLAEWRHLDASELPRTELLRHVIEHALLAAHRHVFGVFFWFVVLSALGLGPAGAVLYRMAEFASRYWAFKSRSLGARQRGPDGSVPARCSAWIDHVPARLTAFGFAVVGNFEEAVRLAP
jgi:adenosylcobinamide-phosphate synthase